MKIKQQCMLLYRETTRKKRETREQENTAVIHSENAKLICY